MKRPILFLLCLLPSLVTISPPAVCAAAREVVITIDEGGFDPPVVTLSKGEQVRLVFIRKTDKTCATRVKIPEMGIDSELPLSRPVSFLIEPERSGEIGFACPMDMLKGRLEVR